MRRIFAFQQIADVYHADNLILIAIAERKTRVLMLLDELHDFVVAAVLINTFHFLPRDHNLMRGNFRKANSVLDNFAFRIVNDTALLRGVNNQFDFLFGMRVFVFVRLFDAHQFQNPHCNVVKYPDKRSKNLIKRIQRRRNNQRIAFGILYGHGLRHQFAENNVQQRDKGKGNTKTQRMEQDFVVGKKA